MPEVKNVTVKSGPAPALTSPGPNAGDRKIAMREREARVSDLAANLMKTDSRIYAIAVKDEYKAWKEALRVASSRIP